MSNNVEIQYPSRLIKPTEAARVLGRSRQTLAHWRMIGGGPKFIKISSNCVMYEPKDLVVWIDAHRCESNSETRPTIHRPD